VEIPHDDLGQLDRPANLSRNDVTARKQQLRDTAANRSKAKHANPNRFDPGCGIV
jgi:hypothetical protein